MFVLVGQVLNARGRFGPMMWAPIANNVISVAVLVVYLVVFGPAEDLFGPFTANQELLLGLGSTLGIVAQFLILVPYLRRSGFRFRPRFDFLHTGLGHTFRLGLWTVLFVIVNQIAYTVVVRLASSGTADPAGGRRHRLLDLLPDLHPDHGPALDHHGVARDRDPAAARRPGPPTATGPAWRGRCPRRCAARWPWSSRSRWCCRWSRPTSPT